MTQANTGTAAEKKEKPRYKTLEEMTPEEKEVFDKMPPARQEEYKGRLALQAAQDTINAAREKQAKEREEKKAAREKETAIKGLIKDVREGKLEATDEALKPKFEAMTPPLPVEEYEATVKRIKEDSVSKGKQASLPAKPAYTLTHTLLNIAKGAIIPPAVSASPDSTLSNSLRRYGMIMPLLVRAGAEAGKYVLMDGLRRYLSLPEDEPIPVVVVAGFPDEDTAERAEVTVNRVRSLNVLAVADRLTRMRTRGVEDTEIRRDMGFKTGEIDKLTSVNTNLVPELAEAVKEGHITPSVALSIAKLPKGLQNGLVKTYKDRVKENASLARISESDVEAVRQERAKDAAKRDTPTLAGLSGSVSGEDAKGGKVDNGAGGKVSSSSKAAPKAGAKK